MGMGSGRRREERGGQGRAVSRPDEEGAGCPREWEAGQQRKAGRGEGEIRYAEGASDQTGLQSSIPRATEGMEGFCGST